MRHAAVLEEVEAAWEKLAVPESDRNRFRAALEKAAASKVISFTTATKFKSH